MEVTKLKANFCQGGSVQDRDGAGEDYDLYEVGENGVTRITEVSLRNPLNRCGRLFYDVDYDGKKSVRVFNPNTVTYEVK